MKQYKHPKLNIEATPSTSVVAGDDKWSFGLPGWSFMMRVTLEELLALGFEEVKEEEKLTVDGEELTIEDTRFFINGLRITVDECGLSNEEILERLGAEKGGTYTCEVVEEKEKDWIDECVHDIFEYQRGRPKEDETDTVSVRRIIEKHMPKQKKYSEEYIKEKMIDAVGYEDEEGFTGVLSDFLRDHDLLEE